MRQFLERVVELLRHSGESRNPEFPTRKNGTGRQRLWIPAFAGMTETKLSRFRESNLTTPPKSGPYTAVIVMCDIYDSARAPCQWFSPLRMWTTSPTVICCSSVSLATMPTPEVTTRIWSLSWGVPAGGCAALEVDHAAAEVLAGAVGYQRLAGAAHLAAGPAGDRGGGVDRHRFDFGDSYDAHIIPPQCFGSRLRVAR